MSAKSVKIKEIVIIAIIIGVFIVASVVSKNYENEFKNLIQIPGFLGMGIYIFLAVISNIIAPLTVLPLLPVVVALWGSFLTAVFSIIGWTIGAAIIFHLSRRYGKPFAARLINIQKAEEIAHAIPKKNFFWIVALLRLILPVDLLSFALGLFTKMPWQPYLAATVIGIAPFAFLLAYGVALPLNFQIFLGVIILGIFIILYGRVWRRLAGKINY